MAANQRLAKLDRERLDQICDAIEAGTRRAERRIEVAAPIDLELKRVHRPFRPRVALDHMAARERIVEPYFKAAPAGDRQRFAADPCVGGPAATIAEDQWRDAARRRRHRVAIEQQRA